MAAISWLGHAGFVIESEGSKLAIDPWMDAPTFPGTDLSNVDVVAITHGHFDHVGSAPQICNASGATLVAIHEVSLWAKAQGVPEDKIVGMNKGGTYEHDGWRLTMVDAVHSGGCPGTEGGHEILPGGSAAGFVIQCPDGDVIYHAGDTAAFLDMQLIGEMHDIDIALLPIGGHYTMDPAGAAKAVELLGVTEVVPMHYGTFPILTGTPADLQKLVGTGINVYDIEPGQRVDLSQTVTA